PPSLFTLSLTTLFRSVSQLPEVLRAFERHPRGAIYSLKRQFERHLSGQVDLNSAVSQRLDKEKDVRRSTTAKPRHGVQILFFHRSEEHTSELQSPCNL